MLFRYHLLTNITEHGNISIANGSVSRASINDTLHSYKTSADADETTTSSSYLISMDNLKKLTRSSCHNRPFSVLLEAIRRSEKCFVEVGERLHTEIERSKGYNATCDGFESHSHCNVFAFLVKYIDS